MGGGERDTKGERTRRDAQEEQGMFSLTTTKTLCHATHGLDNGQQRDWSKRPQCSAERLPILGARRQTRGSDGHRHYGTHENNNSNRALLPLLPSLARSFLFFLARARSWFSFSLQFLPCPLRHAFSKPEPLAGMLRAGGRSCAAPARFHHHHPSQRT